MMLNEVKTRILELLWFNENPVHYKQVAEKLNLKPRAVNMHLMGLVKDGYVTKSNAGRYAITSYGREILGFPKIDETLARKVLSKTSKEKAFHFYKTINMPLEISSDNLNDFCEKLKTLDLETIEFHTNRGDFEAWISYLGDIELARRLKLIREENLTGEALRKKIYEAVKFRCDELISKCRL